MKWTKFRDTKNADQLPFELWLTDFNKVWKDDEQDKNWSLYALQHPEEAWTEVEKPEVPIQELHTCEFAGVFCKQRKSDGQLYIQSNTLTLNVTFCPFCGYSIKEKA